ncbi:lysophospholipid acyltransferase family protein [Nocardia jinanensis]|uniref:1-acyl-sn-glycerol-3-phosphate acyltransferase n=1 Tax=Nocardia jinanensis TaxID=382504 RepID=A0A917RVX3_9NOCA|nr:lysophospholipid acyltransferase family protein [Nocardia jinanensis]GGL38252.1 1-acyl-sn-glycerol-3-phosphate acyltransferase [Nocardia jinanensis]
MVANPVERVSVLVQEPPAQHSWMPVSPCGTGCVQQRPEIGVARAGLRAMGALSVLFAYPFVHIVTPASRRSGVQRRFARTLLRACGIRLRVVDRRTGAAAIGPRYAGPGTGVLVACGHIGWADIVVLASVQPLAFVARADLIDWPVLGKLARVMRVVPIERERLRRLPDVVEQIGQRLAAGERIGFFPEGTTWCGRAYGTLRPALFQAAVDSAVPVQPVRLRYLDGHGNRSTVPGFVGDDTLIDSIVRVLRARNLTAEVVLAPVEPAGTDRKDLARRCERAVRAEELSDAAHAVLAAAGRQLTKAAVEAV